MIPINVAFIGTNAPTKYAVTTTTNADLIFEIFVAYKNLDGSVESLEEKFKSITFRIKRYLSNESADYEATTPSSVITQAIEVIGGISYVNIGILVPKDEKPSYKYGFAEIFGVSDYDVNYSINLGKYINQKGT
jgi:hypothetical protein